MSDSTTTSTAKRGDAALEQDTPWEPPKARAIPLKAAPDDPTTHVARALPAPAVRSPARAGPDHGAPTRVLPNRRPLPGVGEPSASRSSDELDLDTPWLPRVARAEAPVAQGGSSSDPPTRFLRGIDQHIELPDGSVVDDYEIEAKLGAGAMGVVYRARHTKLGRRVAIKVVAPRMGSDPQALARFEREARALASLHHPNIVDVSAFGALADRRSYFVMEYLVGEALDEHLERTRLMFDDALDVLDQMARGLEAAHAQGIVHRDLKPANTFLLRIPGERRPVVKLLDFGLAKLAVADGVDKTASGAVIGTALYLSPEQARGPNVDGRTDVYALGCIAYELVLGRHPFPDATTPTAAIAAHLTEPPPPPRSIWPGIPAALDLLLASMVAKDPNYRPTLAQVRYAIASVRASPSIPPTTPRAATELVMHDAPPSPLRRMASLVLALAAGIAIGIGVLGHASSDRASLPAPSAGSSTEAHVPAPSVVDAPARSAPTPGTASAPVESMPDVGESSETRARPDASSASPATTVPIIEQPVTPTPAEPVVTPVIKKSTPRPMRPTPPKPIDRNATINPFAKKPVPR